MSAATRPLLAITMGDPAGIGPEIVLKALAHAEISERCRPLVVGDGGVTCTTLPLRAYRLTSTKTGCW